MSKNIESHLVENRVFKPSKEFSKKARIQALAQYREMWEESIDKPEKFWAREAAELIWQQKWTKVLEWKLPYAKWFVGGKLNVSENCLDRHLGGTRKNKAAIIWEGEPGEKRVLTYQQLHREVCRFANVLKRQGVRKGDRVIIYMPMIPGGGDRHARLRAASARCTRWSSAASARRASSDRINDCGASTGHHRRWRLPARGDRAAEEERGRRAQATAPHRRSSA